MDRRRTTKKLIASVITKMPIGSILLLESEIAEYQCKKIGSKEKFSPSSKNENIKISNSNYDAYIKFVNISNVDYLGLIKYENNDENYLSNRFDCLKSKIFRKIEDLLI